MISPVWRDSLSMSLDSSLSSTLLFKWWFWCKILSLKTSCDCDLYPIFWNWDCLKGLLMSPLSITNCSSVDSSIRIKLVILDYSSLVNITLVAACSFTVSRMVLIDFIRYSFGCSYDYEFLLISDDVFFESFVFFLNSFKILDFTPVHFLLGVGTSYFCVYWIWLYVFSAKLGYNENKHFSLRSKK